MPLRCLLAFLFALALFTLTCVAADEEQKLYVHNEKKILTKVGFGSCFKQVNIKGIWDPLFKADPDLFVFCGDNFYGDPKTEKQLHQGYSKILACPSYRTFLEQYPCLAVYDDHDYGTNNSFKTNPIKTASAKACLDFFKVPADDPRRKHEGVYGAYSYGPKGSRVQVVLLDARYFRDSFQKNSNTMLGEKQWAWLNEILLEPADIRLVVSSIQVIHDSKTKSETWERIPKERKRLFELIKTTKANGVIFLSGDVHHGEMAVYKDFPYPLYNFTSSSFAHNHNKNDSSKPYRPDLLSSYVITLPEPLKINGVSKMFFGGMNFGLIEIEWGKNRTVDMQLYSNRKGVVIFSQKIKIDDLEFK